MRGRPPMRARCLLACGGVLLLAGCARRPSGTADAGRPAKTVQLLEVGTAPLPTKLPVTGVLAAQEELVLGLEVAGRLQSLAVDVGDIVAAGAVLAALDERDLQLAADRSRAAAVAAEARLGLGAGADLTTFDLEKTPAVREAQAVLVEAGLQRERIATIVQQKMQPGRELDVAEAALAVAESRLQRARDEMKTQLADVQLRRIEVQQAEKRLADSKVIAPWPGRIAARHAAVGQVLGAGAAVVTLLRIDPLRLQLRVPDRAAADVAAGQVVEFTVDGSESVSRTGTIVRQGPAIERGDRTRLVEAAVGNADGALLPGAFCRARIVTAAAVPVLVVPRSAVVSFAGVDRVFTVEPGVAKAEPGANRVGPGAPPVLVAKGHIVEIGRSLPAPPGDPAGEQVEVVRGIAAGARIVRVATGLAPAMPVVVQE